MSLQKNAAMCDTLSCVAIQVLMNDPNFKLLDKTQVIVGLIRTKLGKKIVFVRDKNKTIAAITDIMQRKS